MNVLGTVDSWGTRSFYRYKRALSRVDPRVKQQVEGKDAEIAQLMHQIMELHRQAWQGLNFRTVSRCGRHGLVLCHVCSIFWRTGRLRNSVKQQHKMAIAC